MPSAFLFPQLMDLSTYVRRKTFTVTQMLNVRLQRIFIAVTLVCPIFLLPALVHTDYAQAGQCAMKTCVDVYIENGKIVIEAHKGSGPTSLSSHKAIPKTRPKPRVVAPKPIATATQIKPKTATLPKRVAPRAVHKVAPRLSLNERLFKLIPTGNISHEPSSNAIVNIPVIYWCDLPGVFSTKVAIIGEVVDVAMRPSFLWSFGDGSFYATTSPGAAYPNQVITHSYSRAGTYAVVMLATWGGIWTNNGIARAITGEIRKVSVTTVTVANAPTRLTK